MRCDCCAHPLVPWYETLEQAQRETWTWRIHVRPSDTRFRVVGTRQETPDALSHV